MTHLMCIGDDMIIEIIRPDITEEERQKVLKRIEYLAGLMLKGIREKDAIAKLETPKAI